MRYFHTIIAGTLILFNTFTPSENKLLLSYILISIIRKPNAMKYFKLILIILPVLIISSCITMKPVKFGALITPVPETKKTVDIPLYKSDHYLAGKPFVYWHFAKQKQQQLGLSQPETSADSMLFRVWITNPVSRYGQPHGLIEIKYDSTGWNGQLYFMKVDFSTNKLTETITNFKKIELTPIKTSFDSIAADLLKLKFDQMVTDEFIPGYYDGYIGYNDNSTTYSFEYADRKSYRFYQFNNPYRQKKTFWQAEYVVTILELLDLEFNYDDEGHRYFKW